MRARGLAQDKVKESGIKVGQSRKSDATSAARFAGIAYLAIGNERQQAAYRILTELRLFEQLATYNPILVGTFPLDLDIPGSDLDIICHTADVPAWIKEQSAMLRAINKPFHAEIHKTDRANGKIQGTIGFIHRGFPIELYGEETPSKLQNGYRHMAVEYRVLELLGDAAAVLVRQWKLSGLKTEPAFARLLGLPGDPYAALLELEEWSDRQILSWHGAYGYPL